MVTLAVLLDKYIKRIGWTQGEFAAKVGVSNATISYLLIGKRHARFFRAERWADALELVGKEREEFLDAMAVAASPSRIATIIARLERKSPRT